MTGTSMVLVHSGDISLFSLLTNIMWSVSYLNAIPIYRGGTFGFSKRLTLSNFCAPPIGILNIFARPSTFLQFYMKIYI